MAFREGALWGDGRRQYDRRLESGKVRFPFEEFQGSKRFACTVLLLLTFCRTGLNTRNRQSIGRESMSSKQANLLQGTLDLLVLKALGPGELHGLGISRRIEQITQGTFLVKPGSLFPALYRMEEAGWLSSFWGESENNRRAKYYRLTKTGKRQLEVETEQWATVALAMTNALKAT
jgi:transcriptional regulator